MKALHIFLTEDDQLRFGSGCFCQGHKAPETFAPRISGAHKTLHLNKVTAQGVHLFVCFLYWFPLKQTKYLECFINKSSVLRNTAEFQFLEMVCVNAEEQGAKKKNHPTPIFQVQYYIFISILVYLLVSFEKL